MSNLLLKVKMNRIRAHTVFPQSLSIYEDLVSFRKRKWFNVDEMTVTFNHIAQANLKRGVFFSTIEIITSGGSDNPSIRCILNKEARKATNIIEQKIYRAHATNQDKEEFKAEKDTGVLMMEKSLSRLKELLLKGKITDKEYAKKRKQAMEALE
ncbi:hypothetical protein HOK10_02195 [candidate division WWE3 bacterium]|jgi:hypothetical protein|nr:hypothetical protein [candidate division WWE3 bacterium]